MAGGGMTEEELKDLKKKYRILENAYIEQGMIMDAIQDALNGKEPSDFELSYPIVRRVWDLSTK